LALIRIGLGHQARLGELLGLDHLPQFGREIAHHLRALHRLGHHLAVGGEHRLAVPGNHRLLHHLVEVAGVVVVGCP
jgi:hypothetical protein